MPTPHAAADIRIASCRDEDSHESNSAEGGDKLLTWVVQVKLLDIRCDLPSRLGQAEQP
jgi:hypothetical protein